MIKDIFKQGKPVFSIEVFPPKKTANIASVYEALEGFKKLDPSFISVTYGAGGTTSGLTSDIASHIKQNCDIEALSHLTCASLQCEEDLENYIEKLKAGNVENVLALRGDKPKDMSDETFAKRHYAHAGDLVRAIKEKHDFCIAGACYPEKHPESANIREDVEHLKQKVDCGVDFLITQLFYNNEAFYNYMDRIRTAGIEVPITAGLMPVTAISQIDNILTLSGTVLPADLVSQIVKYKDQPESLRQAGLEYTKKQMEALLAHGVDGIHLYSMNKVATAEFIFS